MRVALSVSEAQLLNLSQHLKWKYLIIENRDLEMSVETGDTEPTSVSKCLWERASLSRMANVGSSSNLGTQAQQTATEH